MISAEHRGNQEHRGAADGRKHSRTKPGALDGLEEWIADWESFAPGTLMEPLRHPRRHRDRNVALSSDWNDLGTQLGKVGEAITAAFAVCKMGAQIV
jgi:hypothetical protein